jgi:hypothetical protein
MDLGRLALVSEVAERTYHTILKLADHALSKMVRYVLLHSGSRLDIIKKKFFFFSSYI